MFASIDEGKDDIAQSWQRETEARASLPVFAEHFHTAPQVNKVQAAATSRHCHKQRKWMVSMCLQQQFPKSKRLAMTRKEETTQKLLLIHGSSNKP